MPQPLATAHIPKAEAMKLYMSYKALYETREEPSSPLQQLITWLRYETPRFREDEYQKHMRLGTDADDFVMLYYYEGIRYKVLRNGHALVTGADADDMHEDAEKSLQACIDTILNDCIVKGLRECATRIDVKTTKTKNILSSEHVNNENIRDHTVMGLIAEDMPLS